MRSAYLALAFALVLAHAHAQERAGPDLAPLLRALDAPGEPAREAAADALVALGPGIAAALEDAGAKASADVRKRLERIQRAFDWDLPGAVRHRLWQTLSEWPFLPSAERTAFLQRAEFTLDPFPGGYACLLALAWEREADRATRKDLARRVVAWPGAVHVVARRALGLETGARGVAALRKALVELPGQDQGERRHEAQLALCGALAREQLGDLATPAFAGQLLAEAGVVDRARALTRASVALAQAGLVHEALLLARRAIALAPAVDELRRLEELSARERQGASHLALLRWLATASLGEAEDSEVAAAQARLEARAPGEAPPAASLTAALRLHGWIQAPQSPFHLLTRDTLVVAGARFGRPQTPIVAAWDARTGDARWTHVPGAEPATRIEMVSLDRPALYALADGVLVLHHVTSAYGGSSATFDRAMLRTRLTRLGADGSVLWRRDYDPSPAMAFDLLGPEMAWFAARTDQFLGRAWVVRLGDGQVVASRVRTAAIARLSGGQLLVRGAEFSGVRRIDPVSAECVWERNLDPHVGRGVDATTGAQELDALYAVTERHVLRLEAATGWVTWSRDFAAGETPRGVVASGPDAYVVLDVGGEAWKVVPFAEDGTAGEAFTGKVGREFEGVRGAIVQATWVAPGIFALQGRLVDVRRRRILRPELPVEADLPKLQAEGSSPGARFHLSGDPEPAPYLRFEGFVAQVHPDVALAPRDALRRVADALDTLADKPAADALRATVVDLDPLTRAGEEDSRGK